MKPTGCPHAYVTTRLDAVSAEFVDLAVTLERRGRFDAADIALATSARLAELRDKLATCARPLDNTVASLPD